MSQETEATNPGIDLDWLASKIEYRLFQDCIHCGLCTASCPTFVVNGDENDSPRGRIYLMRAVTDRRLTLSDEVRAHLDLCLDCRACETACPSGVQYGRLIEPFKVALQRSAAEAKLDHGRPSFLQRLLLRHLFPHAGRVKLALAPARILQRVGFLSFTERIGLTRLLPPTLQRMQEMLPEDLHKPIRLPEILPPIGPRRARVALFTGCVSDAMLPETNAATARVLQRNGCEVVIPRAQVCCGAIHYHSGMEEPAIGMMRRNLEVFRPEDFDAIIVNAAGCGAMLKDYHHVLPTEDHAAAEAFVARVRDVSEFLAELGLVPPTNPIPGKVAYHDACHLCHAQKIRRQPRELLRAIPGLELVDIEESEICCGAAGTYNLVQPEMSDSLGRRKLSHIQETGAPVVATGNVGCILQIARKAREAGGPIQVVHPIDLLDQAYGGAEAAKSADDSHP